jgi:3-oxoacyl-[acyl-carrier protein] reductase
MTPDPSMNHDPVRIALVTGASRGIGHASARGFLRKGYRVVAVDRSEIDPKAFGAGTVRAERLDVTDGAGITALRKRVEDEWGPVSVLVNNAGISPKKADGASSGFLEIGDDEWRQVIDVNLTAVLKLSQAFIPGMQKLKWGRIVNVSSLAGRSKSLVAGGSYMASKAGVLGLTRAIAAEMGPFGITANSVAPGRILTEMAMQAGEEVNRRYAEQIPVRRLGTIDEVAAAILYLASEEAGFVNGALIDINGGFYMP